MAIQNAEAIQKLYVAYFNRPADYYGLQYWDSIVTAAKGDTTAVAAAFAGSAEYQATYAGMDLRNTINAIYKNLFGHSADIPGLDFWTNAVQTGKMSLSNAVTQIASGAQNADKTAYAAKVTAATAFTNALDTTDEILGYSGDKANAVAKQFIAGVNDAASLATAITPANLDASVNSVIGAANVAQTFQLTKGLDNVAGTAGNDVIIGSIDGNTVGTELNTLSSIDLINGGAGIDTLKIAHATGDITLGSVSNVEIVEVTSADTNGVTVDSTAAVGVTDLNVVRAAGSIDLTAGATTNVGVSLKDNSNLSFVEIDGGKNVNVALTDAVSDIYVGGSTAATGAVTISATGAASINNTNVSMGDIEVTGGTTVSVTQKATVNGAAIIADGTTETVTQGDVTIVAAATTTDVTVKQDATNDGALSRAAIVGATEVATVKFVALKATESVTVAGLTFTAAKDLTAAEVAQAFANVSTAALRPSQLAGAPATATGDTNGSSVAANGTFSGALLSAGFAADGVTAATSSWASGAATGDTVTFTGRASVNQTDVSVSSTATTAPTVTTTTQGITAVSARNTLGVNAGEVAITGGAALKTVTVDGYDGTSGVSGAGNAALATVTLANGGGFTVASAAATLALNATDVDGTVNVAAGAKTVNAKVVGDFTGVTLVSASAETINVSGTGNVDGNTGTGLTVATAINTSAMTAGSATFTIANGTTTSYTGGAAADDVTITNAGTAISKAISLGAGDDMLTLNGTAVVSTATLSGGEGTDTIGVTGAAAAALSANTDFAGKIDGFEKLAITDTVTVATTVNMANMDGIKYVVSNNSAAAGSAPVKEAFTVDLATSGAIRGADSITFDGITVNLTGNETPAQIAAKFITQTGGTYAVTGVNGTVVSFQALTAGIATDVKASDFVITDADATTAAVAVATTANGDATTAEVFTADFVGSGAIEDGDTIVFKGQTITLASGDNAAAIAGKVAAGTYAGFTTSVTGSTVTFTAVATGAMTDVAVGDFAITNVKSATTGPALAVAITTQGAAAGLAAPTLTIDKMVNDSTLELVAAGNGVNVKMADASGTADTFNIVTTVTGTSLNFGTVNVAGVETIKVNASDAVPTVSGAASIQTATLAVNADKATSIVVSGNSHLTLSLGADAKSVATVDASTLAGNLNFAANGSHVVTVTGGAGADILRASVGTDAKADVLIGGAGNDVLYTGTNGAKLTGGAGNDTFIVSAATSSATAFVGNKEGNTYSEIVDLSAGDLVQFRAFTGGMLNGTTGNFDGGTAADVSAFGKLTATLNESTATFSNFVDAAIKQAGVGAAVWFNYKGDLYVVVDNNVDSESFQNGADMIVKLTGQNGDNLTFNTDFGTAGLI